METILFIAALILCIIGMLMSGLAFSGTWIVLAAAVMTRLAGGQPETGTIILFAILCVLAELFETLAGYLGVKKRGGSGLAGVVAVIGGIIGAIIGSGIFPLLGTIIGMFTGSFAGAFIVEWIRLKHGKRAAKIAWGTVWAKLIVLIFKTILTVWMSLTLLRTILSTSN